MPPTPAPVLLRLRLTLRLLAIAGMVVEEFFVGPTSIFPPGQLVEGIWARIRRVFARAATLAITAPPPAKPTAPAPAPAKPARPRAAPPDPDADLSVYDRWRRAREPGWLVAMNPKLCDVADIFEDWLSDPQVDHLLRADPRYIGVLRALGFMLGTKPHLLPRPYAPHAPDPETLAPEELRPVPRGVAGWVSTNKLGFERAQAELHARWSAELTELRNARLAAAKAPPDDPALQTA